MKLENHMKKLKEHIDGLEWGVRQDNHSAVGFHASQGAIELVSIYLHNMSLITGDVQLKHTWFRSKRAMEERLGFSFPRKKEIFDLISDIEGLRNPLCYGAPKPDESIIIIAEKFRRLKAVIEKELGEKLDQT